MTSSFPSSIDGARSQRKRWEEGHIRLIGISVPRLIIKSIFSRDFALLSLALDAMVPPLSLLAMLVAVMLFVTGLAALLGASAIAFYITAGCFIALTGSVLLAWFMHGRDVLPPNSLFLLTTFVFAKLPLYKQILSTRVASSWARAERNGNSSTSTRARLQAQQRVQNRKPRPQVRLVDSDQPNLDRHCVHESALRFTWPAQNRPWR